MTLNKQDVIVLGGGLQVLNLSQELRVKIKIKSLTLS